MTTIEELSIRGIRNFGVEDDQVSENECFTVNFVIKFWKNFKDFAQKLFP